MFSDNDILKARSVDTVELIMCRTGYRFKREGREYHCIEHDSLVIFADRKGWAWYSKIRNGEDCKGNNAIAWLVKVEKMTFKQAMSELLGISLTNSLFMPSEEKKQDKPRSLQLPTKAASSDKVINYLVNERGISSHVVNTMISKGMLYQDINNNAVFVGFDKDGIAKYACKHGTYTALNGKTYKRECLGSSKMFGFVQMGHDTTQIYVFEAPIDLLSHCSLSSMKAEKSGKANFEKVWENFSRLALGGLANSALERYLIENQEVSTINFCLDNDEAGRSFSETYKKKYEGEGYYVNIYYSPTGKDYNDYLQQVKTKEKKHEENY